MKTFSALGISLVLTLMVAAGTGLAGESDIQKHSVYKLKVADGAAGEFEVVLDSEKMGFDAFDLAEGESYSFTSDDGRPVTISNVDGELWLDVDGQLIELQRQGAGVHMLTQDLYMDSGITVSSADPLDEETRARIVEALQDAGVDQPVHFVDDLDFSWVDADVHGEHDADIRIKVDDGGLHRKVMVTREVTREDAD